MRRVSWAVHLGYPGSMKKHVLIILAILAILGFAFIARAKKAAEAEAELWSEALDPAF